jgi:hypothetical protein
LRRGSRVALRLAWAGMALTALPSRGAAAAVESVDSRYVVYLRPGALVALDPALDGVDLEVSRRAKGEGAGSYHMALSLTRGGRVVLAHGLTTAASEDGRARMRSAPVPLLDVLLQGRLRSLVPRWEMGGFTLDVELREKDDRGPLIYHLHDPDRGVTISWTGLLDRFSWALTALGIATGLLVADATRRRVPAAERASLRTFDATVLLILAVVPLGFSPFAALAVPPLALAVAWLPVRFKRGAVSTFAPPPGARLPRPALFAPALAAVSFAGLAIGWHLTLVRSFGLSPPGFRPHLPLVAGLYVLLGVALSALLHVGAVRRVARGGGLGSLVAGCVALAFVLGLVRALDWATFFYTGGHIDGEFWRHAFYRQNLSLLRSGQGLLLLGLLVALVFVAAGIVARAGAFARTFAHEDRRPERTLGGILLANAAVSLLLVAVGMALLCAGPPSPQAISDTVREAFTTVPEYALVRPLWTEPWAGGAPPTELEADTRTRLEAAGIRLGASRPDYPLLKPSLHLVPPPPGRDKPSVPPGTNVVVVLVESLSSALVDERVHGVHGLTPHLAEFAAQSLVFRRLWPAEFPTVRGEVATLGSFFFGVEAGGALFGGRDPLRSRFLFLSEALRSLGYTAVHVQSDYSTFAETARLFRRNGYVRVLGAESPELQAGALRPLEKTWGAYDEDMFRTVASLLRDRAIPEPFFLSIATTDTHFPYAVLRRHAGTGDNDLLDALHSTDAAFGAFWDYLRASPYAERTLVLVTADHALARRAMRWEGGGNRLSPFDWIEGYLHVPGGGRWRGTACDLVVSQIDLAPTLLDVLDVDVENPFLGLSVFSDRPAHPLVLGREPPPIDDPRLDERSRQAARAWSEEDQRRLLAYLTALARANRIRPDVGVHARRAASGEPWAAVGTMSAKRRD